jgi:hypothetical protein
MFTHLSFLIAPCCLFMGSTLDAYSADGSLTPRVEIVNRFRLLDEKMEQLYAKDLDQRLTCGSYKFQHGNSRRYRSECSDQKIESRQYPGNHYFPSNWNPSAWQFRAGYVSRTERKLRLSILGIPKTVKNVECAWNVRTTDSTSVQVHSTTCLNDVANVTLGPERKLNLTVDVTVTLDGKPLKLTQMPVELRDVVIASLGDSFVSGEGNPHMALRRPPPHGARAEWLDVRCHRSLFTGAMIASFRLAMSNPTLSVTFVPLACSGAEIDEGILTANYLGRETASQAASFPESDGSEQWDSPSHSLIYTPANCTDSDKKNCVLPSQISSLRQALCSTSSDSCIKPDVVVVSTGGNELGFGKVVRAAAFGGSPKPAVVQAVKDALRKLPEGYERLYTAIQKFEPKNVLAIGYIDPTRKAPGVYCKDLSWPAGGGRSFVPGFATLFGIGVTEDWTRFAHNQIIVPLNSTFRELANHHKKEGWRFASLSDRLVSHHGYCGAADGTAWFYTYRESGDFQGLIALDTDLNGQEIGYIPSGAMHPNIFGHDRMAGEIKDQLLKLGIGKR